MDNLENFGYRELEVAIEILEAYKDGKIEDDIKFFKDNGPERLMFNTKSGEVFLGNDIYVMCLNDRGYLGFWYSLSTEIIEGFKEDLRELFDNKEIKNIDSLNELLDYNIITKEELTERIKEITVLENKWTDINEKRIIYKNRHRISN